MGRFEGKVAFVTGAARGQGRSHAVGFAREGTDVIALDICTPVKSVHYSMATSDDLAETVRQVEALDLRIVARQADVRDGAALKSALDEGVATLGRLDVVCANAGSLSLSPAETMSDDQWDDVLAINLGQPRRRIQDGARGDPVPARQRQWRRDHHYQLRCRGGIDAQQRALRRVKARRGA